MKLADRLHNMRTLEHLPPPKRARQVAEMQRPLEETVDAAGFMERALG